jgi:hypothetical protein
MPQNIADSATSSFMQLGDEPNLYAFPVNNGNKFISRWNKFSPTYTIEYENISFNEENPYGFTFNINKGATKNQYSFTRNAQQGPSLDYLLSLTLAATTIQDKGVSKLEAVQLPSKCLNIGSLEVSNKDSPFLDIKRSGDGDQADGADIMDKQLTYVVLVTGDRLLSVQARLMNQRCILQYHQTLTVFRGVVPGATPAQIAEYNKLKEEAFVNRYTAAYTTIISDKFIGEVATFSDSLSIPAGHTRLVDVVKGLLSFKLEDMKSRLKSFVTEVTTKLKGKGVTEDTIKLLISELDKIKVAKSDIYSFTKSFSRFDIKKDIAVLKYSFKPYVALSSAIVALGAKITSQREMRGEVNYFTLANQEGGYNSSLREILISMPMPPAPFVVPGYILDTMKTKDSVRAIIKTPITMAGGSIQEGGALDAGQMMARAFLFREICSIASSYIRTTLAPHIPNIIKISILNNLKYSKGIFVAAAAAAAEALLAERAASLRSATPATADAAAMAIRRAGILKKKAELDKESLNINLASAKKYDASITLENIDARIADTAPLLQEEIGKNLMEIFTDEERINAKTVMDQINFTWQTKYLETVGEEGANIGYIWNTILDPFKGDASFKDGHPVNTNPKNRFFEYPEIPGLITLAIMNDILNGAVTRNTSPFTRFFSQAEKIPAVLKKIIIHGKTEWEDRLQNILSQIYYGIVVGETSKINMKKVAELMGGGSKTRMMKRRKRKGSPRRMTLRKTRKHK